jgi:protein-L-isoaspartate(D-aspartate) O-methyltransferase
MGVGASNKDAQVSTSPQSELKDEYYTHAREQMVRRQLARRGISNRRVLDAMMTVPRHFFVPPRSRHLAYSDGPLSIGHGQTISQPYIVALMTQLLQPEPEERVLEIGVGSGYQTAILAELVEEVIGLECIPDLAEQARERIEELGYENVMIRVADGSLGYAQSAPYDGILAAAAAPVIPEPLTMQLADDGRLVIPVGSASEQIIERAIRRGGSIHIERLIPVRFVPLIGKFGFKEGWY